MDVDKLESAIGTIGFPIVCVLALAWFIWKLWTKQQEQNENRENKLYDFILNAQSVNEKLTKTNAEFVTVLNTYKSDLEEIKGDVTIIKNNFNK